MLCKVPREMQKVIGFTEEVRDLYGQNVSIQSKETKSILTGKLATSKICLADASIKNWQKKKRGNMFHRRRYYGKIIYCIRKQP